MALAFRTGTKDDSFLDEGPCWSLVNIVNVTANQNREWCPCTSRTIPILGFYQFSDCGCCQLSCFLQVISHYWNMMSFWNVQGVLKIDRRQRGHRHQLEAFLLYMYWPHRVRAPNSNAKQQCYTIGTFHSTSFLYICAMWKYLRRHHMCTSALLVYSES